MREEQIIHERRHNYSLNRSRVETAHVDYIKEVFIDVLRATFAQHPEYTYVARQENDDEGFIGPEPDFDRTRIVITDVYTYNVKFLPVITVRVTGSNAVDVSFSQNKLTVDYLYDDNGNYVYDSYGHPIPIYYEYAGAWESQVLFNISTEDTITREELITFLSIILFHLKRDELFTKGIFVKSISVGGETEEPYGNDYMYKQTVTANIWSEWTHRIPVGDTITDININSRGIDEDSEEMWDDYSTTNLDEPTVSTLLVRSNGAWAIKTEWIQWWQEQFNVNNAGHLLEYDEYDGQPIPFFVALINVNSLYRKSLKQFQNEVEELRQTLIAENVDEEIINQLNLIESDWRWDGDGYGDGYGVNNKISIGVKERTLDYLTKRWSK